MRVNSLLNAAGKGVVGIEGENEREYEAKGADSC